MKCLKVGAHCYTNCLKLMDLQINKFECEFHNYSITTLSVTSYKTYARYKCNHTIKLYYGNHLHCDHQVICHMLPIYCKHILLKFSDMVEITCEDRLCLICFGHEPVHISRLGLNTKYGSYQHGSYQHCSFGSVRSKLLNTSLECCYVIAKLLPYF